MGNDLNMPTSCTLADGNAVTVGSLAFGVEASSDRGSLRLDVYVIRGIRAGGGFIDVDPYLGVEIERRSEDWRRCGCFVACPVSVVQDWLRVVRPASKREQNESIRAMDALLEKLHPEPVEARERGAA